MLAPTYAGRGTTLQDQNPNDASEDDVAADPNAIDAMPTKAFFVEMLIRDIPLERAVLDLVDNCIDGAKRLRDRENRDFSGLRVDITVSADRFVISDNCGGFSSHIAKTYAFRFGRDSQAESTKYSIGQFGVGMKRALFKFGRKFTLTSATAVERWTVDEDVDTWERKKRWTFEFKTRDDGLSVPPEEQGTTIVVERLRPEVSSKFSSLYFTRSLAEMIRIHQRQFIARGLEIWFNGASLSATNLELLVGDVAPAVDMLEHTAPDGSVVRVRLVAGVGASSPTQAGWYVVCNGRVVLAADRTPTTGWGLDREHEADVPRYHNQFARFRGVAYFECENAAYLPWNTTKTGVDADIGVWRVALEKMIVLTRAIIDFLNEVDRELEDQGSDGPLQRALGAASKTQVETITAPAVFQTPDKTKYSGPRKTRIAYTRPVEQVAALMEAYGVGSAKAVGERTFDAAYQEEEADK